MADSSSSPPSSPSSPSSRPSRPSELKGPVLLVTRDRALADRVRELLTAERFEVHVVRAAAGVIAEAARLGPSVVVIDWALDDEPSCEELVYQLRPRKAGLRVIAVRGPTGAAPGEVSGVRAVLARPVDAEELVDLVWRHHHEVRDTRGAE
jgi:DNA-binding response OmpR family regulator